MKKWTEIFFQKFKMSDENLIHIRLDYREAFNTKKGLLSSQMYLLRLLRNIESYKFLRMKELQQKQRLVEKIKKTKTSIKILERTLPKAKIPKYLKKSGEESEKENFKIKTHDRNIESQLSEIKRKLDNLQRENLELI